MKRSCARVLFGRRSRPAALAVVAALAALALAACGPAAGGADDTPDVTSAVRAAEPALPVRVKSADGRTVEVRSVDRIVPLAGSIAEVVFALGLGGNVVGRDISTTFPAGAKLPLVTRAHDVSAESLLALRPTLVLAQSDSGPPEALEQIRNAGVPVIVFEMPTSVASIEPRVRSIGAALGLQKPATELAASIASNIAKARSAISPAARANSPRVAFLYMRGTAGVYLIAGPGSGTDSMIAVAGGIDAGTAMGLKRPFTPLTSEALVKAAPDVILMTTTGLESVGGIDGLLGVPGIAQTPAGRDRRIVTEEDGLLFGFGTRTPQVITELIKAIHAPAGS